MHDPGALIALEGVTAGYRPPPAPPALRDVGFSIEPGERVAVLGPNGGGKTTLFRVLLGELAPAAGEVRAPRCAMVPQTERSRLDFPVSALDVALMGSLSRLAWWRRPGRIERDRARDALAAVGLDEHADTTFGELSGGQRQRVLIARALVQDAQVILLDEPFTGLDGPAAERLETVMAQLAGEGRALLIATHDVLQAHRWDRVLCVNRRQIAYGVPGEVLTRAVLEETYGEAIVALPGDAGGAIMPAHHHHHHHDPA